MNDVAPVSERPSPAGAGAPTGTRSVLLLAAAAVLVVVVVGLVLVFGVARPPELEPIEAAPAVVPPARVAWVAWEDEGQCLWVAGTDGQVDDVRCDRDGGEVMAWTDEGILVHSWRDAEDRLLVVDPEDGSVVDRRDLEPDHEGQPGLAVFAERRDGRLVLVHERGEHVIWEVDAPSTYDVHTMAVSPDGDWVALVDSAGRLLLVPADGATPPRVWVEDVASWAHLVWEGAGPAR